MTSLRIYIVISTFHPLVGGVEKQALLQGRSLREKGHEATIITFRHSKHWLPREEVEGVPTLRVAGWLLDRRERLPRVIQKGLYLLAMIVMGATLWQQRHAYDVLHVYQLNLLALLAALVCLFTGKPLLISVRSADSRSNVSYGTPRPPYLPLKAYRGESLSAKNKVSLVAGPLDPDTAWLEIPGQAWSGGDLEGLERLGRALTWLTYALLRHVQPVVTLLSTRTKGYLVDHHFALPNTRLIPNGVDITRFRPRRTGVLDEERAAVVVCVAQLRYEKGVDVLLQAWRLVRMQLPASVQPRLRIVGGGPIRGQLERLAQALELLDSIEFVGQQQDIAAQLHMGDVAVLPSRWEGMPNALLEAMACGLACVATRVSGSEDIVQHGANGLLVEPEDYQNMAQALLLLLQNPSLARAYGEEARITIERSYALEHITESYIQLYQQMTNAHVQLSTLAKATPHG